VATVTSLLTRIHDAEGSLTTGNIPAGGASAAANTDIFLQASQSLGRRQTTTGATPAGFALVDAADNDCSASGTHVGMWIWVTHYGILQTLAVSLSTGTTPSTNYDQHNVPLTEYPNLGGWVRVWVHVNRTPDATAGAGLTESQVRCYGVQCSFTGTPGGNAANLILDAADYVTGPALRLTGTSGLWSDLSTSDQNTTNQYGVFRLANGVNLCRARIELGGSSSLVFSDSNFVVIFPQQGIVSDTWMGINVDLQHASTSITWANGVVRSVGAKKGDLVVSGSSGVFVASGMAFGALRVVTLNASCSVTSSSFVECGQITADGATLNATSVSGYEGTADTSAVVWNVNTDVDGKLDNCSFTKGTVATHAVELGTSSPTSLTFQGVTFSGYNASNGQNDSTVHVKRTSGTVTINLVGCSGNFSYRTDGAAVTVVVDPVTLTITAIDSTTANAIQGAQVLVVAGTNFTGGSSISIARSGSTATVTHTGHGFSTGNVVRIRGADQSEYNGVFTITVTGSDNYTYTVTGTPATPATGTIVSALVIIDAITNSSGQVSDTRSWSIDQPFVGRVRRGTTAPAYKSQPISGTIDNTTGATVTAPLVSDA